MLNQNDIFTAINNAIKQSVEIEYERYKEQCLKDLTRKFEMEKNEVVKNILNSIEVLFSNENMPGHLNVQINIKK